MKILTEEQVKFKGRARYLSLKEIFNRRDIGKYYERHLRQRSSIGSVMELMHRFKPQSLENAFEEYIKSGYNEKFLPLTDRGRDFEELEEKAIAWKNNVNVNLPLEDFFDALVLHAVVETYDGYLREKEVKESMETLGYKVIKPSGEEDNLLGIDLIAEKDGKILLIQVKPYSFFYYTTRNESLIDDRFHVWEKQEKGVKKYGPASEYRYYIYDANWEDGTSKWIISEDGSHSFEYGKLVGPDGQSFVRDMNGFLSNKVDKLH